jgi:acyl carrier protein
MTRDEIDKRLRRTLTRIAPEAGADAISLDADLRRELELASMDFLGFVTAIDRELHVTVPEAEYRRLFTLRSAIDYLLEKLGVVAGSPAVP